MKTYKEFLLEASKSKVDEDMSAVRAVKKGKDTWETNALKIVRKGKDKWDVFRKFGSAGTKSGTYREYTRSMPVKIGITYEELLAYVKKVTTKPLVGVTENKMLEARKSKYDYQIHHSGPAGYSSAVNTAKEVARKRGYEVDEDDWFNKVSTGPRKPSEGKTNSFKVLLTKNGKPVRNMLVFQVYGMKNSYELTAYIS